MINERIPMNELEADGVDRLLAREATADVSVSIARDEPGEKGSVRVEIGERAWLVDGEGRYRKVAG